MTATCGAVRVELRCEWPRGGMITQRPAKPCTLVQFQAWPPTPNHCLLRVIAAPASNWEKAAEKKGALSAVGACGHSSNTAPRKYQNRAGKTDDPQEIPEFRETWSEHSSNWPTTRSGWSKIRTRLCIHRAAVSITDHPEADCRRKGVRSRDKDTAQASHHTTGFAVPKPRDLRYASTPVHHGTCLYGASPPPSAACSITVDYPAENARCRG